MNLASKNFPVKPLSRILSSSAGAFEPNQDYFFIYTMLFLIKIEKFTYNDLKIAHRHRVLNLNAVNHTL